MDDNTNVSRMHCVASWWKWLALFGVLCLTVSCAPAAMVAERFSERPATADDLRNTWGEPCTVETQGAGEMWTYCVNVEDGQEMAATCSAGCTPTHRMRLVGDVIVADEPAAGGLSQIRQTLPPCDPELGCGGGGEEGPSLTSTLSLKITNTASVPMHFTLGASVMDETRSTLYANAVPLSGTVLNPGETRTFTRLLSSSPNLIFIAEAVGYDVGISGSSALAEPVVATTTGDHLCEFTYTLYDVGRMTAICH